ncbi:MAG: endonuclease/exonuclease/phosphatase family protein [Firmicutes bacterium]|nr:endonuclease/exonuclease/phosphatase family protein [Bacillota bacterium]
MKIVTWNCNMAFRKKWIKINEAFDPDIMVIQECEAPDKLGSTIGSQYEILWIGDNSNKGLAVISKNHIKAKQLMVQQENVRYMLPVELDNGFKIIAFWAMNDEKDLMQRYIGQVWIGLNKCLGEIDDKTIILGDFNWNVIWDRSSTIPLYGKLTEVIDLLKNYRIESAYHYLNNERFGEETVKTFCLYRKNDKSYHTDYMFLPVDILKGTKRFTIGGYKNWIEYSDHMPLYINF